jgi:hypothetical protein
MRRRIRRRPRTLQPQPPPEEAKVFDAFDRFLERYVDELNAAAIPHPSSTLSALLIGGLLAKELRLADAILALARAGRGRESGSLVRTMLTVFVNLRFLATYEDREAAAAAYVLHLDVTQKRLKRHVVRQDRPEDAFPVLSARDWAKLEQQVNEQRARIRRERIRVMKRFRPRDRAGKPQKLVPDSWTGMTDRELFDHVGQEDGYRFYSFYSNELHANVSGLGNIFSELSAGGIDFVRFDDALAIGPLIIAAKYSVLAMETFDAFHQLDRAKAIETISDDFTVALRAYRQGRVAAGTI